MSPKEGWMLQLVKIFLNKKKPLYAILRSPMFHWFLFWIVFHAVFIFSSEIAVVTLAVGAEYKESVRIGIENKQLYCRKHGYDFICLEESLDKSRPIQWTKVLLLQKILETTHHQWIFWSDADSMVMNLGVRLEDFIDPGYNLIIGKDCHGVNSGQFFLRNCPWSLKLLSAIYARTECIHHPWWEQRALQLELEERPEILQLTKIVPQRLFNSYAREVADFCPSSWYKPGDFILHFPGAKNLDFLSRLFYQYEDSVVDSPEYVDLDLYLMKVGFDLSPLHSSVNEGYMTESQKQQFVSWLQFHPHIKKIAEIGLNAGHSAENFFLHCPALTKLISFDIQKHAYTKAATEYLAKKYKERFLFIPGDSVTTVQEFAKKSADPICDLIYIDGGHSYETVVQDIVNCKDLAGKETVLWIDDFHGDAVRRAIYECHRKGLIHIKDIHWSFDPNGERAWVEACYTAWD